MFNVLSASIIMGFMVIPTIASVSEDAMSAVPQSLREGSFGLGATQAADLAPGGLPRGAVGHRRRDRAGRLARGRRDDDRARGRRARWPQITADPREPMYTMTSYIASIAKGDIATGSVQYKTVFAVGMLLFVITLILNAISIRFVRKYRQVYE